MMDKGGNDELQAFFEKFNLNDEAVSSKYMTKAAQYYRMKLNAMASGDEETLEALNSQGQPSYHEGRMSF
jgi:hypothetical protein